MKDILEILNPGQREKHKPVPGALYRSLREANGKYQVRVGDLVMVVSEKPHLVENRYVKKTGINSEEVTVVQEWADLSILWSEVVIPFDGLPESTWYYWFERVEM